MNGLLENGITLTQPDPRPPFWEYMSPDEMKDWDNIPILRQSLTKKYSTLLPGIKEKELMRREEYERDMLMRERDRFMDERDMLMRRSEPPTGLLGEGDIPLPPNWGNLVHPEGGSHPDSRWYEFPSEQGLLEYNSPKLADEVYRGTFEYPEHAPNTPEHRQAYNFLRKNNFGGGI
jgi:hypothetical protein